MARVLRRGKWWTKLLFSLSWASHPLIVRGSSILIHNRKRWCTLNIINVFTLKIASSQKKKVFLFNCIFNVCIFASFFYYLFSSHITSIQRLVKLNGKVSLTWRNHPFTQKFSCQLELCERVISSGTVRIVTCVDIPDEITLSHSSSWHENCCDSW